MFIIQYNVTISRVFAGPSESQLQNTWWRADFPFLNWVVCLSHRSPLPGKRFCFCARTGETLHLGLFLGSPCPLPTCSLPVSQPGGNSTGENDWPVSVGVGQGLCGGSPSTFGADRQTGRCHNLQPLLQGKIFYEWVCADALSFIDSLLFPPGWNCGPQARLFQRCRSLGIDQL